MPMSVADPDSTSDTRARLEMSLGIAACRGCRVGGRKLSQASRGSSQGVLLLGRAGAPNAGGESRASSRSDAGAKAVGVGSGAWFGKVSRQVSVRLFTRMLRR
jgi:hypothetical protein